MCKKYFYQEKENKVLEKGGIDDEIKNKVIEDATIEDIEEGEIKELDVKPIERRITPPSSPQYSSVSSEDFLSSPIKQINPKAVKRCNDLVSDYLKGFGKRRKKKGKKKKVKQN